MQSKLKAESELQIITHLLQTDFRKNEFDSLLQNEIDWDLLLQLSEEHRVIPLLFKRLKSDHSGFITEEIFGKFQKSYKEIAKFNFARSTQLIKLISQLQEHNLPVITYKGMALAEFAYKDTTLRQFGDIDLLIHKKDFPKVKEVFMQMGCKPVWELTEKQEKAVLKYYYEYPFFYGEVNTLVEVHWEFLESFFAFDIEMKDVWNRSQIVNHYGREIETLSAEDYLVFLCTHGSKHFWYRLSWICDVAKLIENTDIDWDLAQKIANKTGTLRMMRLGLYLAKELLKTELPKEIGEQVFNDSEALYLGKKIKDYLLGSEIEPTDWIEVAKLHLKMREKMSTKIKFSQRLFTTKLIDKLFMPMGRPR
jgi:hypothetical protein